MRGRNLSEETIVVFIKKKKPRLFEKYENYIGK